MTHGQVRFFARQYLAGYPIPIFIDNRINRAINKHVRAIRRAQTKRRYNRRDHKSERTASWPQ